MTYDKLTDNELKDLEVINTTDFVGTKIYFIRDEKVLLDFDLASLYGVETKRLKEQLDEISRDSRKIFC